MVPVMILLLLFETKIEMFLLLKQRFVWPIFMRLHDSFMQKLT